MRSNESRRTFTRSAGASGVKTIDDAMRQEVTVGATGGSTSSQYPKAMNALLGTKFKIILGYPGGNDINLAMERGEVAVRGSNSWGAWKATRPDWLRDKKINILVQTALEEEAELTQMGVPAMWGFVKNDLDRKAAELVVSQQIFGRPYILPPGTPEAQVKILREAFDKTFKDPEFLEDAKKSRIDIAPSSGEKVQDLVARIFASPADVVDRAKRIIQP